jgi:hypothetical protein
VRHCGTSNVWRRCASRCRALTCRAGKPRFELADQRFELSPVEQREPAASNTIGMGPKRLRHSSSMDSASRSMPRVYCRGALAARDARPARRVAAPIARVDHTVD